MINPEMRSAAFRKETCKNDLLCCILGIRRLQSQIYWLISGRDMELRELASRLKRDRTSVQKAAADLIAAGIATRSVGSSKRGKKYVYRGITLAELRLKLTRELDSYYLGVKSKIDEMR